jgi:hypothetical protein
LLNILLIIVPNENSCVGSQKEIPPTKKKKTKEEEEDWEL